MIDHFKQIMLLYEKSANHNYDNFICTIFREFTQFHVNIRSFITYNI